MAYTFETAREQVLEHLDDRGGSRYARVSGAPDFKFVDRALKSAVGLCMRDYVEGGGDRFDEQIQVSTLQNAGTVDLTSFTPLKIRGVLYAPASNIETKIEEGDPLAGHRPDLSSRALTLIIVRRFDPPALVDPTDLLTGTIEGAARADDAFDEWVCCRAALQLGIKDDEMRKALIATIADLASSIIGEPRNPQSLPWGNERYRRVSPTLYWLQWLYTQRTQTLSLITGGR